MDRLRARCPLRRDVHAGICRRRVAAILGVHRQVATMAQHDEVLEVVRAVRAEGNHVMDVETEAVPAALTGKARADLRPPSDGGGDMPASLAAVWL